MYALKTHMEERKKKKEILRIYLSDIVPELSAIPV